MAKHIQGNNNMFKKFAKYRTNIQAINESIYSNQFNQLIKQSNNI